MELVYERTDKEFIPYMDLFLEKSFLLVSEP
jgi:hypothetical protein